MIVRCSYLSVLSPLYKRDLGGWESQGKLETWFSRQVDACRRNSARGGRKAEKRRRNMHYNTTNPHQNGTGRDIWQERRAEPVYWTFALTCQIPEGCQLSQSQRNPLDPSHPFEPARKPSIAHHNGQRTAEGGAVARAGEEAKVRIGAKNERDTKDHCRQRSSCRRILRNDRLIRGSSSENRLGRRPGRSGLQVSASKLYPDRW